MSDAVKYGQWIIDNQDKKGTSEFKKVQDAFNLLKADSISVVDTEPKTKFEEFDEGFQKIQEDVREGVSGFFGSNIQKILDSTGSAYTKVAPGALQYKTAIDYDQEGQPFVKEGRLDPIISIFNEPQIKKAFANEKEKKKFSDNLAGYITLGGTPIFWDDMRDEHPTIDSFLKEAGELDARRLVFKNNSPYDLDYSETLKKATTYKAQQMFTLDPSKPLGIIEKQKIAPYTFGNILNPFDQGAPVQGIVDYIQSKGVTDSETLATIATMEESGELPLRRLASNAYDTGKFLVGDVPVFLGRTVQRFMNYDATGQFVPYSSKRDREVFNDRWLASSADDLRKRLLQGGVSPIVATQEFAETLLSYSPSITDRGIKMAIDIKGFTGLLGVSMLKSGEKEFKKFKDYIGARPRKFKMDANGKMTKGTFEEAVAAYKKDEYTPRKDLLGKFLDNIRTDRLVRGIEVDLAKKPADQKEIVIANRKLLDKLFKDRDALKKKKGNQAENITDIERQIREQRIKVAAAENLSNTPKFLRELGQGDAGLLLFGAAGGQLNQSMDNDPVFGEFLGITIGLGDLLTRDTKFGSYTFGVPVKFTREFVRQVERKSLQVAELVTGKGTLLAPKSPQILKQEDKIVDFANLVKTLNPETQKYVQQRVLAFAEASDELIKLGVSKEALNITLSKLTGLAAIEAFELSVRSEMFAGQVLNADTISSMQNITDVRQQLVGELTDLSNSFTKDLPSADAAQPVLKFINNIKRGLDIENQNIKNAQELLAGYNKLQRQSLIDELASEEKTRTTADIVEELESLVGIALPTKMIEGAKTRVEVEDLIQKTLHESINNVKIQSYEALGQGKGVKIAFNDNLATAHVEKMMESVRVRLENKGRSGFKQLDADPTLGGAKTDASNLFNRLMEDVTSFDKGARIINDEALDGGDARALINQFDAAADRAIFDGFPPEEILEIKKEMKKAGYKQFSSAFMFDFINRIHLKDGDRVLPIELGFEETQKIESSLGRIQNYYKLKSQTGDVDSSNKSRIYADFKTIANGLFRNFKSAKGVSMEGVAERVQEAKNIYATEYAQRYFNNKLAEKLVYTQKLGIRTDDGKWVSQPTTDYPEAKLWKTPSNKWFDVNKFANNPDESSNFNKDLVRLFGKKIEPSEFEATRGAKPQYVLSIEDNPDLAAYGKHLALRWVAEQLENVTNAKQFDKAFYDNFEKGITNIQEAFKTNKGDGSYLFTMDDFFERGGAFSIETARKNSKKIDTIASDTEAKIDTAIRGKGQKFVRNQIDKLRERMAIIQNVDKRIFNAESLFNEVVEKGTIGFDDLKQAAIFQSKMKPEEFDEAVRVIVAKHINEKVFNIQKNIEVFPDKKTLASNMQDTDFEQLGLILTGGERGPVLRQILGEDHYNVLLNIQKFMELQKIKKTDVRVMGIPRSLSVESWISRVYSINRGVVSPKYVATEAALQAARKKNISTLELIINNPDAAQIFAKVILDQKPIGEELNSRLLNSILYHATFMGSRFGYRDYLVGAGEVAKDARMKMSDITPDLIEPKNLKPTQEQMKNLKLDTSSKQKKLYGEGTNYKSFAEWKAANMDDYTD